MMPRIKTIPSNLKNKSVENVKYADQDILKNDMVAQFEKLKPKEQIEILQRMGVGVSTYFSKQKFATC